MASRLIWLLSLSLYITTTHGRAFGHSPSNHFSLLRPRQNEVVVEGDGEDVLDCSASCELGSNNSNKKKRFNDPLLINDLSSNNDNLTTTHGLDKRVWKITTNGVLFNKQPPYQVSELNDYLYHQMLVEDDSGATGTYDNQYGPLLPLASTENEAAYSQARTFGSQPFQIGTIVGGCQVVTVVSPNGVWMAHFWESYTNGKPNVDVLEQSSRRQGPSYQAFEERMIFFLTNQAVPSQPSRGLFTEGYPQRAPTTNHPYLTPIGGALDVNANYMNPGQNGQGITAYIATPLADGEGPNGRLKYQQRVQRVIDALHNYLGPQARIAKIGYHRLGEGESSTPERASGLMLFQYDPDSTGDGQNVRSWRLFYDATEATPNT